MAKLTILTNRHELEYRVTVRLGDEVLHCGVHARLEVRSRGRSNADISLEDWPGLLRRHLPDDVITGVTPAGQAHPPGRASIAYPADGTVRCDQPAPSVVLYRDDGVRARLAGLAAPGCQQVAPGYQVCQPAQRDAGCV